MTAGELILTLFAIALVLPMGAFLGALIMGALGNAIIGGLGDRAWFWVGGILGSIASVGWSLNKVEKITIHNAQIKEARKILKS